MDKAVRLIPNSQHTKVCRRFVVLPGIYLREKQTTHKDNRNKTIDYIIANWTLTKDKHTRNILDKIHTHFKYDPHKIPGGQ